MKRRWMGIDYGDVRTGLAVSDPLGILACGIGTVTAPGKKGLTEIILAKAAEYGVDGFVVGNPINMNGTAGERSEKAGRFAAFLAEQSGKPVILFDERCTTMAAHRILNLTDTRGKKRKAAVDTLSAQIILQNFMDSRPEELEQKETAPSGGTEAARNAAMPANGSAGADTSREDQT